MANNGNKLDDDPEILARSDSKPKLYTGGKMKELKSIIESMPKGQEGREVIIKATDIVLKSQLKIKEYADWERKAILESLRKGLESRELRATLEFLKKFQAGTELMAISKSPEKGVQHLDTKMFSEELRKVLDRQDRLDEMMIELEAKFFGLHHENRNDHSRLGESDHGTEREQKDAEDQAVVTIRSSAEEDHQATDVLPGEIITGDDPDLSEYVFVD